ncbi:hypothetical protein ABKV19_000104 [Rosa sericea]
MKEVTLGHISYRYRRVLVLVEKGGEIGVIEEFLGGDGDKSYWVNSVLEVVVGEGGKVRHSYVQNQSVNAAHIKWTSVHQVISLCSIFSSFLLLGALLVKFCV